MRSVQTRAPRAMAYLPILLVLCTLAAPAGDLLTTAAWAQDPPAQQPAPPPAEGGTDVDVTVRTEGAWYADPVWLAVGACLLILIVALIVAGSRSTTTVVK